MQEFEEGLGRMKGQCSFKFKLVIQGNIFMSLPFFLKIVPRETLICVLEICLIINLKKEKNGLTVLRVLRMRRKEPLDKEDEITEPIALPPNAKSFCVEFRHQKPKKNPFPILTQLVTA